LKHSIQQILGRQLISDEEAKEEANDEQKSMGTESWNLNNKKELFFSFIFFQRTLKNRTNRATAVVPVVVGCVPGLRPSSCVCWKAAFKGICRRMGNAFEPLAAEV
jgi:hypothetical protein